jgi:hypothetical protein
MPDNTDWQTKRELLHSFCRQSAYFSIKILAVAGMQRYVFTARRFFLTNQHLVVKRCIVIIDNATDL